MTKGKIKYDLVIGLFIVCMFMALSFADVPFFKTMEVYVYDLGSYFSPHAEQEGDPIALIVVDDKSLDELGPWPWPRRLIADMIALLHENGVRLIGLNILFDERENNRGLREIAVFREKFEANPRTKADKDLRNWVLGNLDEIQQRLDSDEELVNAIKQSGNVILPLTADSDSTKRGEASSIDLSLSNYFLSSPRIPDFLKSNYSIERIRSPFPELAQSAAGLGFRIPLDRHSRSRRSYPLFVDYRHSLLPSFALRLAIAFFHQTPGQVRAQQDRISIDGRKIPLTKGEIFLHFTGRDSVYPRYSFSDVMGSKDLQQGLRGKILLIGLSRPGNGEVDLPVYPNMSRSELNARIVDSLIHHHYITRPFYMSFVEASILFLAGSALTFILSRKRRSLRFIGTTGVFLVLPLSGFVICFIMGTWFDPVYIASGLICVMAYFWLKNLSFRGRIERHADRGKFRDLDNRTIRSAVPTEPLPLDSHKPLKEESVYSDSGTTVGSSIGRYKIVGELGKGSMGLILKAWDPKIYRQVALKTIRFSDEFDEDIIEDIKKRFFREAEIAGRLSHPSIVTIHDVGDDRDITYMAMEFLEGEDLDKFTEKTNLLPFRKVLDIISGIAQALEYAHKADVIHRDIKPANIMLLKNGQVKVTDFGIAKAISSSRTKTGVILGTPNYMSPEQIMGQKIDYRSDIFSLGVLFYHLITGELPFHSENLSGLLYQITQVKHPSPRDYNPKIPGVCVQILDKALAKNPEKRFRSAGDMAKVVSALGQKLDELRRKKTVNE